MKRFVVFASALLLALVIPERCRGSAVIVQLFPSNIVSAPITVRVEDGDFGKRFVVFYKTNEYVHDEFLHATLGVNDEDNQIASCAVEKQWTTNGVGFSFAVAPAYLEASKFTLLEDAHDGRNQPIPGFTSHWFYLRDFVTNSAPATARSHSWAVSSEIMKELPGRIRVLRRGATADQVWQQLGLASYRRNLGGVSFPTKERYWLNWNHEFELVFEELQANARSDSSDNRKLIRATLFKNGREIVSSHKD